MDTVMMINTVCTYLIFQETQRLMQEPVPGISAIPDDDNARYFHVVVAGPEGSPFEGGVFKLELFLPEDYPMSAPKVSVFQILIVLVRQFDQRVILKADPIYHIYRVQCKLLFLTKINYQHQKKYHKIFAINQAILSNPTCSI